MEAYAATPATAPNPKLGEGLLLAWAQSMNGKQEQQQPFNQVATIEEEGLNENEVFEEDDEEELERRQRQRASRQVRRATGSSLASGTSSASSSFLASSSQLHHQQLIQSQRNAGAGGSGARGGGVVGAGERSVRCCCNNLKQMLQSIPIPLAATSLVILLLLGLLLATGTSAGSQAATFRFGTGVQVAQALRSAEPQHQEQRLLVKEEARIGSAGEFGDFDRDEEKQQQQSRPESLNPEARDIKMMPTQMLRQIIAARAQKRDHLKRNSEARGPPAMESGEGLSSLLMSSLNINGQEDEVNLDGGPPAPAAHQRQSSLELELPSEPATTGMLQHQLFQQQEPQIQPQMRNQPRHRHHQQVYHRPHPQPPTHSTTNSNEDNYNSDEPQRDRPFDVPQIHCNSTWDHHPRFGCPTPDANGLYRCIADSKICDGYYDCPGQEDESPTQCLYFKVFFNRFDLLVEALELLAKKQSEQTLASRPYARRG